MNDESFGPEGMSDDDRRFTGSRFSTLRDAIFANPYTPPYERFETTFGSVMRGAFRIGKSWVLLDAAKRTLASAADLRWGTDGKGFRRLLHPNGICLIGMWEITEETPYSGYFRKGSRGLVIARYSTCCTETRRGRMRSLAIVGRIYPTTDRNHPDPLPTANFITQQDIGGEVVQSINEAILLNAPNTTTARRGAGASVLGATGVALKLADKQPTIRQVYQVAELGKPDSEPTCAPEFMRFTVPPEQPVVPGDDLDFRDEIMAQVYNTPNRKLVFRIETTDEGKTHGNAAIKEWREFTGWRAIGTMTFDEACASYNGDRVVHFQHPRWRKDRNDPKS